MIDVDIKLRRWLWPLALLLVTACAARARLLPVSGPGVERTPAGGISAVNGGVILEARPDAWAGVPDRLTKVTPVLVTIDNGASERIRLRYNELVIKAADGREFHALPPFDIRASQSDVSPYPFPSQGFIIAPYHARFFPRFRRYPGVFALDTVYFQSYYSGLQRYRLPTTDMVVKALPEGVLEPQGKITGFLYFENVDRDLETVTLSARFASAESGETIAEFKLPFQVD